MIEVRGTYFDGISSEAHEATLHCVGELLTIRGAFGPLIHAVPLSRCDLDPPVGKTSRSIRFPGGAVFETADCDSLILIERSAGKNRMMRIVHSLELRWKTVAVSLAGIVLFVWLFHTYAIPILAKKIAFALPPQVTEEVSSQTMRALDYHLLKPSELTAEKTAGIRKDFSALLDDVDRAHFIYRLEFRRSPVMGPNAFALPSGTVVMTDELVNLSENEAEIRGILLHEIAHVKERHALRSVVQNAGIFLVIAALAGDLSGISSAAASLPTIVAHAGYSRTFEREADRFAALYFIRRGWSVKPMQDILGRMAKNVPRIPGEAVLSTHLATEERIRELGALAETNR
ncbi:MAG: M48 family metallopeptidase [Nitrospiraceae bacterium]|nr:M48 family metallopeptidase [Nitrospiraceae bacterium]